MVGDHDILVSTSRSDREPATVIIVNFSDVADMDMKFVRPYRQVHLVVCMCHDHSVRFGWARFGLGISNLLEILDHITFEIFVDGWEVRRGINKGKAWPSAAIYRFDGFEPHVTDGKTRCSMKVTYQGLSAW